MSNLIRNEEVSNTQHLASLEDKSVPEDGIRDALQLAPRTKDEQSENRHQSGGQKEAGYGHKGRCGYKNAPPLGGRKRWW
jgi:hypothetical protein